MTSTKVDLNSRPCPDHADHRRTDQWMTCKPCRAWGDYIDLCWDQHRLPDGHVNHFSQLDADGARIRVNRPVRVLRSNGKRSTLRPGEYRAHPVDERHTHELELLVPDYDPNNGELWWRYTTGRFSCQFVFGFVPDEAVTYLGPWVDA